MRTCLKTFGLRNDFIVTQGFKCPLFFFQILLNNLFFIPIFLLPFSHIIQVSDPFPVTTIISPSFMSSNALLIASLLSKILIGFLILMQLRYYFLRILIIRIFICNNHMLSIFRGNFLNWPFPFISTTTRS